MLANQQPTELMAILADSESTFEGLVHRFSGTFSKPEYFRAAWVIQHLIHHNVLLFEVCQPKVVEASRLPPPPK
jgi:hypothetical protein